MYGSLSITKVITADQQLCYGLEFNGPFKEWYSRHWNEPCYCATIKLKLCATVVCHSNIYSFGYIMVEQSSMSICI